MNRLLTTALLSLLALSLSATPLRAQNKTSKSAKPTASETRLLNAAKSIAKQVGQLRGLPLKQPIKQGVKDRKQLRNTLITLLSREVSDAQMRNEQDLYILLGLLPPKTDYKQLILDLLTEQIAGFYDQHSKELYIMQGIPMALQRPAMAHELFHGIQDQHFDILKLQAPFPSTENGDFALARSALLEGDATLVMVDFILTEAGQLPQANATSVVDLPVISTLLTNMRFDQYTMLDSLLGSGADNTPGKSLNSSIPLFLRDLLIFPYSAGLRFVAQARYGQSWSAVDNIYKHPPVSTEQILHPERYFQQDDPTLVTFSPQKALPPSFQPIYDNVLGELQLYLFLKQHLDAQLKQLQTLRRSKKQNDQDRAKQLQKTLDDLSLSSIRQATAGWDGDRILAYRDKASKRLTLVHLSVWDSTLDAEQYFKTLRDITSLRFPHASHQHDSGKHGQSACLHVRDPLQHNSRVYIEQWGDMVLHIEGAPSSLDKQGRETNPTTTKLRALSWASAKRSSFAAAIQTRQRQLQKQKKTNPTPKKKTSKKQRELPDGR